MASPNPESAARRIESFSGYAILTYAKAMPPNSNALRGLPQIAHATATTRGREGCAERGGLPLGARQAFLAQPLRMPETSPRVISQAMPADRGAREKLKTPSKFQGRMPP